MSELYRDFLERKLDEIIALLGNIQNSLTTTVTSSGMVVNFNTTLISPLVRLLCYIPVSQSGSGTPSSVNPRPFISHNNITLKHSGFDLDTYSSQNIIFNNDIYGGYVNVVTGEVFATHGHIDSYNGETLTGVWASSIDEYVEGTLPTIGGEVVYELTEPILIETITPRNITTYYGVNNVWNDTGNTELEYKVKDSSGGGLRTTIFPVNRSEITGG
jgi:hypothetical protein